MTYDAFPVKYAQYDFKKCDNSSEFFYADSSWSFDCSGSSFLDELTFALLFFNRHEGELCPREITSTKRKRELTIRDPREKKRAEEANIRWCLMVLFEIIMDSVCENKGLFLPLKDGKRRNDKCVDAVIRSKSSPIIVQLWTSATVLFLSLSSKKNRRLLGKSKNDAKCRPCNLDKWPPIFIHLPRLAVPVEVPRPKCVFHHDATCVRG